MGRYADLANAVATGGATKEEALAKSQAIRKQTVDDLMKEFAADKKKQQSGMFSQIANALGVGAAADRVATSAMPDEAPVAAPEVAPAPNLSPAQVTQTPEGDNEISAAPFYKVSRDGMYYLLPGIINGKQLTPDEASTGFLKGRLDPVYQASNVDAVKAEEMKQLHKMVRDEENQAKAQQKVSKIAQGLQEQADLNIANHILDAEQQQFINNERAIEKFRTNAKTGLGYVIPDNWADTEPARIFMRGQATDQLGFLGKKEMEHALQGKVLPKEDQKRIKELQAMAAYKSPREGDWSLAAMELLGQMFESWKDPNHNPAVGAAVAGAGATAATAYLGPGSLIPGSAAAGMTYKTLSMLRTKAVEEGNAFLELKNLKHEDGTPMSAREAGVAAQLIGGINGALEVSNFGAFTKMFPGLSKYMNPHQLVMKNPAFKKIVLDAAKRLVKGTVSESLVESAQEVPGIMAAAWLQDKDIAKELTSPESAQQIADVFKQTFKGTAVIGAPGAAAHVGVNQYSKMKEDKLAKLGVDITSGEAPPNAPAPAKKRVRKPSDTVQELKPEATPAAPAEAKAAPAPSVPAEVGVAEVPEGKISVGTIKDKATGTLLHQVVNVDPLTTPALAATTPTGEVVLTPTPESFNAKTKVSLLADEPTGYATVQHEDGSRTIAAKRIWQINSPVPIKSTMLIHPAILSDDHTMYVGPQVNPIMPSKATDTDLDSMMKARSIAERLAIKAGEVLDSNNPDGKPVTIKDTGFVITGPPGSPAAGQPIWISAALADQKFGRELKEGETFKGKKIGDRLSLQEVISLRQGDKHEITVNSEIKAEKEKTAEKNKPLTAEETAFAKQEWVPKHVKRVTFSLSKEGMDLEELQSIAPTAMVDAMRATMAGPTRTPEGIKKAFQNNLRGKMSDAYKKSFGTSVREHDRMRKEGVSKVSLEAAGVENKPVAAVGESLSTNLDDVGASPSVDEVRGRVNPNSPIKKAQSMAEAGSLTKAEIIKKSGKVKVLSPQEKAAFAAARGQGVTPSKVGPAISKRMRAEREAALATPAPVSTLAAGKAEVAQILKTEQAERRSKESPVQTKQQTGEAFQDNKATSELVRELSATGNLLESRTSQGVETEFKLHRAASMVAQKIGGTVIPVRHKDNTTTYVVSKSPLGRVLHDYEVHKTPPKPASAAPLKKSKAAKKSEVKVEAINKEAVDKLGVSGKTQVKAVATQAPGVVAPPSIAAVQAKVAEKTGVAPQVAPKTESMASEAAASIQNDEEYGQLKSPDGLVELTPSASGTTTSLLASTKKLNKEPVPPGMSPKMVEAVKKQLGTSSPTGEPVATTAAPKKEFIQQIQDVILNSAMEVGVTVPALQKALLRYGNTHGLLILKQDGQAIYNGISNIFMRSRTDPEIAKAWVVPVGNNQYILFRPDKQTQDMREKDGTITQDVTYWPPEPMSVVPAALDYNQRKTLPGPAPVGSSTARVGGQVTVKSTVEEQIAAAKAAEEVAVEKNAGRRNARPEMVKVDDTPVQLSNVELQMWAGKTDVGDKVKYATPSAHAVTLVDPTTGGIVERFTTKGRDEAARADIMKQAQEAAKKFTGSLNIIVTRSATKIGAPATNHVIEKVIERGANPVKRVSTAETGRDGERGSSPELAAVWNAMGHLSKGTSTLFGSTKRAFQWTARALDVEYHWDQQGMHEIGFAIKNFFSRRDSQERQSQALATKVSNLMWQLNGGKAPSVQYNIDTVLSAESKAHFDSLDPAYQAKIKEPMEMLRKYMDDSKAEFDARDVKLDFKSRMLGTLQTKLDESTDIAKKQHIQAAMDAVNQMDFVHIPYRFLFQKRMGDFLDATDPIMRKKRLADFKSLINIKRSSTSIAQLLAKTNKSGTMTISAPGAADREINNARLQVKGDQILINFRKDIKKETPQVIITKQPDGSWKSDKGQVVQVDGLKAGNIKLEFPDRTFNFAKSDKWGEPIVKKEEINPANIILNYGYNKGMDHALLDIRDAIGAQSSIVKKVKTKPKLTKDGYEWVHINQPKLQLLGTLLSEQDHKDKKKLFIRKDAFDSLNQMMGFSERQTKYDKFMSLAKMAAFFNPFMLPFYNTLQSIRAGVINPMHPIRTLNSAVKAFNDVGGMKGLLSSTATEYSKDYIEALDNGLESKPFSNPFSSFREFSEMLNGTKRGNWAVDAIRVFSSEFKRESPWAKYTLVTPVIKSLYQASWHIAWAIDGLMRMQAYNYLKAAGYNPREAAGLASNMQGDYASVPPQTRKVLNKFLFTPTFKIATLKLYSQMMKSAMKVGYQMITHPLSYKDRTNKVDRRYATSALLVYGVNLAFDTLMTKGLGFEPDEDEPLFSDYGTTGVADTALEFAGRAFGKFGAFGRRYRKNVVDEEGRNRTFYMTFSTSENVVQRYMERVRKAFFAPGVKNPFTEFAYQNRWELHPVYRQGLNAITGQGDDGPIWPDSNIPMWEKGARSLVYFTKKTINMLDAFNSRIEWAANKKQRDLVFTQWNKDYGKGVGLIVGNFFLGTIAGYDYLANPVEQQMGIKLKQLQKQFKSDLFRQQEAGAVDPSLITNYVKEQQAVISFYGRRLKGGKP